MSDADIDPMQRVMRPLFIATFALLSFIAFILAWAVFAPLATTIALNGNILSAAPSFALQHPYGGLVQEVLVAKHDVVDRGQTLLRLDVSLDEHSLGILQSTYDQVSAENATIEAILQGKEIDMTVVSDIAGVQHLLRRSQAELQQLGKQETAKSLTLQAQAIMKKIEHEKVQLSLMRDRAKRQDALVQKGLMSKQESEIVQEQILIVEGEINGDLASLYALEDQLEQTTQHVELISLSMREELNKTLSANTKQLVNLEQEIAGLRDRIEQAEISAPIDGTVTDMFFEADGMFVARGATLLSLSKPLEAPHINFRIPVHLIDQMRPGLTGRMIIPSLPQRNLPAVQVTVRAISPRAEMDENGNPVSYSGLADVDPDALADLRTALEADFQFSEDMPVQLMITGRETTFSKYLVAPFFAAFQTALQD